MSNASSGLISSLYIHVPFCAHKCEYCAFYSEASSGELINRYVGALVRELELVAADLQPRTIFFGGGTPSLLNLRQWETILQAMQRLDLLGAEEPEVPASNLTMRERECLGLLRMGLTDEEIARAMQIAHATVRGHLDQARLKLGARNRAHLAAKVAP